MELNIKKKESKQNRRLRREGKIPAVTYGNGPSESVVVERSEFEAVLRKIEEGCLPTTVLALKGDVDAKAIVKGIQYDVTSYDVIHLDLQLLDDKKAVNVNVPIHFTGANECSGIKLGGVLRQVIRHVPVNCLPKDIPSKVVLDVAELNIGGTKRLGDITFSEGVQMRAKPQDVAVVIAKK